MTVHPHACGERTVRPIHCWPSRGSSPRMWGTEKISRSAGGFCSVHPHACGERELAARFMADSSGSSPRMWGTGGGFRQTDFTPRFIPTHVGNGAPSAPRFRHHPVHPHACGERCAAGGQIVGYLRFIPTHVGNGPVPEIDGRTQPVHPHACGERLHNFPTHAHSSGSSPRMWGTALRANG